MPTKNQIYTYAPIQGLIGKNRDGEIRVLRVFLHNISDTNKIKKFSGLSKSGLSRISVGKIRYELDKNANDVTLSQGLIGKIRDSEKRP